jgi:hypothetical protein
LDRNEERKDDLSSLSNREFLSHVANTISALARKEADLAKAELRQEINSGFLMTGGFGVALIAGFVAVIMLLVTAVMALSIVLPGWGAGLIVSGLALSVSVVAAILGWLNRVKGVLPQTKEILKGNIRWTKSLKK